MRRSRFSVSCSLLFRRDLMERDHALEFCLYQAAKLIVFPM